MGEPLSRRLVRFCGADCGDCEKYRCFLAGDESGLVNPENQYRCFRLISDVIVSAMGGVQQVAGLHGGGSPVMETITIRLKLQMSSL